MNAHTLPVDSDNGSAEPKSGRNALGRFTAANKGGPGNPFGRRVAALKKAALAASSEQDVQEVMDALKGKAKQGDVAAAKLYLQYTLGQPAKAADPDRVEVDEWELHKASAVGWNEWVPLLSERVTPDIANLAAHTLWPNFMVHYIDKVLDAARTDPDPEDEEPSPDGPNGEEGSDFADDLPTVNGSDGAAAPFEGGDRPSPDGANGAEEKDGHRLTPREGVLGAIARLLAARNAWPEGFSADRDDSRQSGAEGSEEDDERRPGRPSEAHDASAS